MSALRLVLPSLEWVPSYKLALERGWSPNNVTPEQTRIEELDSIEKDAKSFCDALVDLAPSSSIKLPDGSYVPKLPGYRSWMIAKVSQMEQFVGSIGFRWQDGSDELPPYCLGHIGYSVVPWEQAKGYATEALKLLLSQAQERGLKKVEITTQPDNIASRRVIEKVGGICLGEYQEPRGYGGHIGLKYFVRLV